MKITDISISKQIVDGVPMFGCVCTTEDGAKFSAHHLWLNERGLWASKDDARDPAEISATLRSFAAAIEQYTQAKVA